MVSKPCARNECNNTTTNMMYCSRSCAVAVNNSKLPKRQASTYAGRKCKVCNISTGSSARYCSEQHKKQWQSENPRKGSVKQTADQILRKVKTCSICRKEKSIEQFTFANASKQILNPRCKKCHGWLVASTQNKILTKNRLLVQNYGITLIQYYMILDAQGGVCSICHSAPHTWYHVDHDHTTNIVRGILCETCNTALGLFYDDIKILQSAIQYLQSTSKFQS